jgi:hypothetical protein
LPEATQSGPSLGIEHNLSLIVQDYPLEFASIQATAIDEGLV